MRVSATAYLVWATLLGMFMTCKIQIVLEKNFHRYILTIFVGWYFWRLGEMSEFCIVRDEPMLILLVCLQDRQRWS